MAYVNRPKMDETENAGGSNMSMLILGVLVVALLIAGFYWYQNTQTTRSIGPAPAPVVNTTPAPKPATPSVTSPAVTSPAVTTPAVPADKPAVSTPATPAPATP